jgi:hypothetical protein
MIILKRLPVKDNIMQNVKWNVKLLDMSGQLHALATLPPEKESEVPTE